LNAVPIKTFADIILFELQKELMKQLTFSQMWRLYEETGEVFQINKGRADFKNFIARDIYNAVEELEEKKLIVVIRRRVGRYQRILQIDATPEGKLHLEETMFTHQPHKIDSPVETQRAASPDDRTDSHK
jgi:hypothetical protein